MLLVVRPGAPSSVLVPSRMYVEQQRILLWWDMLGDCTKYIKVQSGMSLNAVSTS